MAASSKNQTVYQLIELHLVPHHIYMINEQDSFNSDYVLEMWKDDSKMGEVSDIRTLVSNSQQNYSSLQFRKLCFIFDVQALFEKQSSTKIRLKLTQNHQSETIVKQQFQIHILYYNYQYSQHHLVKRRQNSIGKLNQYVFNYSFIAIYGQPTQSPLFRKFQSTTNNHSKDISSIQPLTKNQSKYGFIATDHLTTVHYDTMGLLDAVSNYTSNNLIQRSFDTNSQRISVAPTQSQQFQRKASRSILRANSFNSGQQLSGITQVDTAEKIRQQSSFLGGLFFIAMSVILVYLLMHPNKKF